MTTITITELTNIGSNIAYDTLVPVVNMTGTPETQQANLQILGNLILSQAGGNFVVAAAANTIVNAVQANITSVGTLTGLNVSGSATVGNIAFNNATVSSKVSDGTLEIVGNGTGNINLSSNSIINLATANITNPDGGVQLMWVDPTDPGAIRMAGLAVNTGFGVLANNRGNVQIVTTANVANGLSPAWTFGNDGNLTLPGNTSNINHLDGTPYGSTVIVTAAATGAQTITNASSAQVLAWTEISDTSNSFSGNIFTAPYAGFYQVNLSLYWGSGIVQTAGFVAAAINPTGSFTTVQLLNGPAGSGAIQNVSRLIQLAQGDELEFLCAQTTGSDQTPAANGTTLSIYRIG